jgi:preprotein translocase subunit SecG
MQSVLVAIHLMVVVALVVTVLLQRSEGGALGVGGGGGFMSGRGQANVLTRATSILAALFFATSLGLTVLAKWNRAPDTILQTEAPAPAGQAPAEANTGTLFDQLKQLEEQQPKGPATAPAKPLAPPPAPLIAPKPNK